MTSNKIKYFSADGFKTSIRVFTQNNDTQADVILCLPAMGTAGAYYQPFAKSLVEEGYHVVTADWRGKGLSELRASQKVDFGYREIWHYDYPALFDCVRAEFPRNRILVYGHSLGGQLGSLYLAAHPEAQVTGLILHFSCHCHYRNWDRQSWKMYLWFKFFPWIAALWGHFPGKQIGFAQREARTFMRDWGFSGIQGKYQPKGLTVDYDSLGHQLQIPILAFSLEGDQLGPKKGVEHLCSLFPNASVRHHHLTKAAGDDRPYSHFNWVYQPAYFIKKMQEWQAAEVVAEYQS